MSATRYGHIYPPDAAWLAKAEPEEVIDPALPIIDTHHHLWQREDQRYLLPELLADIGTGHNTIATVFLECHAMYRTDGPEELRSVGETEFVAGIAAMSDSGGYGKTRVAAGIVGNVDLTHPRAETALLAHIRAGGGRFRGVRHAAGWDEDPIIGNSAGMTGLGTYMRSDFRHGLRTMTALGLSLDAWVFHPQLDDVIDLARAVPSANIIMGHCGGPLGYGRHAGKRDEIFSQWKQRIQTLATCPNVTMKLGGMMMRLAAYDYKALEKPPTSARIAELWGPYIETCIEAFGPQRCLFESNFPVEKMGASWVVLWNAFKRITAGASAEEKRALFSGTAERAYRLGPFLA